MSGACLCVCVCAGVCVEVAFSMGSQLHPNPPFIQSLLGTKAVQWAMGNRISRMPPEDVRSDNSVPHHLMDSQYETQEKMPSFETKFQARFLSEALPADPWQPPPTLFANHKTEKTSPPPAELSTFSLLRHKTKKQLYI